MIELKNKYKNFFTKKYKYGFEKKISYLKTKKGIDLEIIKFISKKKVEPTWMLMKRMLSYRFWLAMATPTWAEIKYKKIKFKEIFYYAEPKYSEKIDNLTQIDQNILKTYKKLGIPIFEQKVLSGIAMDTIFDSTSVAVTYKKELEKYGIIFSSISTAVIKYSGLTKLYFGQIVDYKDNFFSALNSTVYSDGTFVYIPKNITCPIELSSYFRINELNTGQFERTLIVADEGSNISYLEGCSATIRKKNQLHAAVVELIAMNKSSIKYSTVQNWYPGNEDGYGGIYNFVTKRGVCKGNSSKISWIQIEIGSAITWKYPSCILQGNNSIGKFFSIALTKNYQQADTGTKMLHIGEKTKSKIIAKGIATGKSRNIYRGLVKILCTAKNSKNYTQCDSLIIGKMSSISTIPYIESNNSCSNIEHEASISKINYEQLKYCNLRGISTEDSISLLISGFCRSIFKELPLEFFMEARILLYISIEGAIG